MSIPNPAAEPSIFNADCILSILEVENPTPRQIEMATALATDLYTAGYRAGQEDAR